MSEANKQEGILIVNNTEKLLVLSTKGYVPVVIHPNHNYQITSKDVISLGTKIKQAETSTK